MLNPKVLFLDFDGVVVDSNGIKDSAFEEIFKSYSKKEEILKYHYENNAVPRDKKFHHIAYQILNLPPKEADTLIALWLADFEIKTHSAIVECPFIPGAERVLRDLSNRYLLVLASATPDEHLRRILKERKISNFFYRIQGASKSKAQFFDEFINELGIDADDCLFVGDSPEDLEASINSKIPFVAITRKFDFKAFKGIKLNDMEPLYEMLSQNSKTTLGNKVSFSCVACESTQVLQKRDYNGAKENVFLKFESINLCENCGLGTAFPQYTQEELNHFYASGKYWSNEDNQVLNSAHQIVQAFFRLKSSTPYFSSYDFLNFLDIGAGNAYIADWISYFIKNKNVSYSFIEPDLRISNKNLEKKLGFEIRKVSDSEYKNYNFIFLNQVLEHMAEPHKFLKNLFNTSNPGTRLYVEVPNRDYLFKDSVFPHIYFFTPESLERLLSKVGWKVLKIESFGVDSSKIRGLGSILWQKINSIGFRISARFGIRYLMIVFNNQLFNYSSRENGIWIRAIVEKEIVED